jgi:hypothetical protein
MHSEKAIIVDPRFFTLNALCLKIAYAVQIAKGKIVTAPSGINLVTPNTAGKIRLQVKRSAKVATAPKRIIA